MKIPYINLVAQWENERAELLPIIDAALSTGQYVGGLEIERLEERVADLERRLEAAAVTDEGSQPQPAGSRSLTSTAVPVLSLQRA